MTKGAMQVIPYSPSNVHLGEKCLRKYQAQYVTKEYKPKFDSAPAVRGIIIHGMVEHSLIHGHTEGQFEVDVNGVKRLVSWEHYRPELYKLSPALQRIDAFRSQGWEARVEYEAAINHAGEICGWWDKDCFARSKIDVLLVSPDRTQVIIWDWKTGKASNINPFQMPLISLILASEFGVGQIFGSVDYLIDLEQPPEKDTWTPKYPLIQALRADDNPAKFIPLVTAVRKIENAYATDHWPTNNTYKWCPYCELVNCPDKRRK